MKYKVTNPLEQTVKCGKLVFAPKETKVLEFAPEGFNIEKIEQTEQLKNLKGGNK